MPPEESPDEEPSDVVTKVFDMSLALSVCTAVAPPCATDELVRVSTEKDEGALSEDSEEKDVEPPCMLTAETALPEGAP